MNTDKKQFHKYIIIFTATFLVWLLVEFYALFIFPIVYVSFQKTLGYDYSKCYIMPILFGKYNYLSYIFIAPMVFNLLIFFCINKLKKTIIDNSLIILLLLIVFYLSVLHFALIEPGI